MERNIQQNAGRQYVISNCCNKCSPGGKRAAAEQGIDKPAGDGQQQKASGKQGQKGVANPGVKPIRLAMEPSSEAYQYKKHKYGQQNRNFVEWGGGKYHRRQQMREGKF